MSATPGSPSRGGIAHLSRTTGLNPYVSLLYGELARLGLGMVRDPRLEIGWLWRARRDVAVLHFSWGPNRHYAWSRVSRPSHQVLSGLKLGLFAARLLAARVLGYRIVWTIHEVYPPHSGAGRRLDRLAGRLLARASHALIAHDRAVAETARGELGGAAGEIEIVRHGSFAGVYPPGRDRAAVRRDLRIAPGAFVFLSFGQLREDKDFDLLFDAFHGLPHRDVALVVAGPVSNEDAGRRVTEAAAADARVRPLLGTVADDRVAELYGAVDAAVLARSEVWTSGSLILALSLGLPAVASRLPPHEELLGSESAGWLFEPGDVASLRAALERAIAEGTDAPAKRTAAMRRAAALPLWPHIARSFAGYVLDGRVKAGRDRARAASPPRGP